MSISSKSTERRSGFTIFLGYEVSLPPLSCMLIDLQDERLYTIDPLALHHIFVKHQYIYEETPMFLTRVFIYFNVITLLTGQKNDEIAVWYKSSIDIR